MKTAANTTAFTKVLMRWHGRQNKRTMPWKEEKDPYKIWLSEIILQQTRVQQGTDYYIKFIQKYPTVKALAAADDIDVFKLWEGLGYYSRCKNLLAAARFIAKEYGGIFPFTYENILALKGVGPYTASAIASFAYNLPRAVVDGNVNRVLARFFGIKAAIDSTPGKKIFSDLAHLALDKNKAALYNQAIMDFGATICKPRLPLCSQCVLKKECIAFNKKMVLELPVKEKKTGRKNRWFLYVVARHKNKVWVKKRTAKDIWQNLHEFFLTETSSLEPPGKIPASLQGHFGGEKNFSITAISEPFRQQLTHQHITAIFIDIKMKKNTPVEGMDLVEIENIKNLAFPRLINHYLEKAFGNRLPES
jgi:A/G-specific adenine glycosylase